MDNFEWRQGYVERFGLHYIDFNDPKRSRVPKLSALFYHNLIRDHGFVKGAFTAPGSLPVMEYEDESCIAFQKHVVVVKPKHVGFILF
jgi:hypothetical protein